MRRDLRSTEAIRADIEMRRARMHDTLTALERKGSPRSVLDSALGGDGLRGLQDVAKRHPVPLGILGVGAAWLAAESAMGTDEREAARDLRQRAASAKGPVGQRAADAQRTLSERTGEAQGRVRESARRAQDRFSSAMERQPFAVGALAFGLGLASGFALPSTRWEDERMGARSDALTGEARRAGEDALRSAREIARDSADAMSRHAGRGDPVADAIGVGAQTAAERAHEEGLDADGIRERAREARERAREQAET